ncbi:hypothetical protein Nmel_015601, partial [Mimus melanotis]
GRGAGRRCPGPCHRPPPLPGPWHLPPAIPRCPRAAPRRAGQRTRSRPAGSALDALPGAAPGLPSPPGSHRASAGRGAPGGPAEPVLPRPRRSTYRERRRRLRLHMRPGTHQAREGRRRPEPGRAAWAAPAPPGQVPRLCPVSAGSVTAAGNPGLPGLRRLGPVRGAFGPSPTSSTPEPDYISQWASQRAGRSRESWRGPLRDFISRDPSCAGSGGAAVPRRRPRAAAAAGGAPGGGNGRDRA